MVITSLDRINVCSGIKTNKQKTKIAVHGLETLRQKRQEVEMFLGEESISIQASVPA